MPPIIDEEKCIACNTCAEICPMQLFGPVTPGKIPQVLYPYECWHCRACIMDCPVDAISMRYPLTHSICHYEA